MKHQDVTNEVSTASRLYEMDYREQYTADLPHRVEDEEDGARAPAVFVDGALKVLSDVLTARGRLVRLPSAQLVDLTNLHDAASYLLSRGFCFRRPFQELAAAIQRAASVAAPPEQAEASDYDALLEIADAVHDLDRAMDREFHKAENTFLQLQIWLSKVAERTDIPVEDILKAPDAKGVFTKLHSMASERLGREPLERLHDSRVARLNECGCGMPEELAQRLGMLPSYAVQLFESKLDWKYVGQEQRAIDRQVRASPR